MYCVALFVLVFLNRTKLHVDLNIEVLHAMCCFCGLVLLQHSGLPFADLESEVMVCSVLLVWLLSFRQQIRLHDVDLVTEFGCSSEREFLAVLRLS